MPGFILARLCIPVSLTTSIYKNADELWPSPNILWTERLAQAAVWRLLLCILSLSWMPLKLVMA